MHVCVVSTQTAAAASSIFLYCVCTFDISLPLFVLNPHFLVQRERELHLMLTYFTDRHWSCEVLYCWYEVHMTINRSFSLRTFALVCASRGKNRRHAEALIKHRLGCSANKGSVAALTS